MLLLMMWCCCYCLNMVVLVVLLYGFEKPCHSRRRESPVTGSSRVGNGPRRPRNQSALGPHSGHTRSYNTGRLLVRNGICLGKDPHVCTNYIHRFVSYTGLFRCADKQRIAVLAHGNRDSLDQARTYVPRSCRMPQSIALP